MQSEHEREVQLRDLRRVNPRRRIAQNEAVVLVRRKAILVSVPLNNKLSVNAIITHDKVLWLLPGDHKDGNPALYPLNNNPPLTPTPESARSSGEPVKSIFDERPSSEAHRLVLLMARAVVRSSHSHASLDRIESKGDLYNR